MEKAKVSRRSRWRTVGGLDFVAAQLLLDGLLGRADLAFELLLVVA